MTARDAGGREQKPLPAVAARAQLGDRAALEELVARLQTPLYEHILGIVGDSDAAADVLQDVLLIVCRRLTRVRTIKWVRAWAYRIATRAALRALKRQRARAHIEWLDERHELAAPPPDEPRIDPELLAALPARLDAVPPAARLVLRMHYLQELTQPEVAEALGIPLGTVKSRIAYGLAALRRTWPIAPARSTDAER